MTVKNAVWSEMWGIALRRTGRKSVGHTKTLRAVSLIISANWRRGG